MTTNFHLSRAVALGILLSFSSCAGSGTAPGAPTEKVEQQRFETPEELVAALKASAAAGDFAGLDRILGPDGRKLLFSGDSTLDRFELQQLSQRLSERAELIPASSLEFNNLPIMKLRIGRMGLNAGIPLINEGQGWRAASRYFAPRSLKRRIASNEIEVWRTCLEYAEAQRQYFSKDRNADGVREYALRMLSTPGAKDGLYWKTDPGEEPSPLAEVVAQAQDFGYEPNRAEKQNPQPFHGYLFKILTKQGKWARDGARDYMAGGRMTKGFALIAYPVEWGLSGVRTFMVGPQGMIYGKNLGFATDKIAEKIEEFGPDRTWVWVQQPQVNDFEEYLETL
jgi:hypothetical protein